MSLDRRRSKANLSALLRRSVPARLSQLAPPPPTVDDATRREFLIGAAGLLLLPAGCGSGREDGGEAPGQTRTVRHALGETRIPANPRRMVVLDVVTLEHVLALGMMPVGYPLDGGAPPPYLESMLDGVESVGTIGEPSLERIAVLEPDLIVGWGEFFVEPIHEELSEIGPTVGTPREGFADWKEDLRYVADVVGAPDRADKLLDEYERRVSEVREGIGPERLQTLEVSVFRAEGGTGTLRLVAQGSFASGVLADVGVRRPPSQQVGGEFGEIDISLERLSEADGDVIFIPTFPDDEESNEALAEVEASPLWNQLRAVQEGRVYNVDINPWLQGSVTGARLVLDDLEKHLAGGN